MLNPLPVDDPKQRKPDITKARTILGWDPKISREEGLKITYEYFKNIILNKKFYSKTLSQRRSLFFRQIGFPIKQRGIDMANRLLHHHFIRI